MPNAFEDSTYHPLLVSADNHNEFNEEDSWTDPSNWLQFGKGAAISGFYSLANSAISAGRWVGLTNAEDYDISEKMYSFDEDLGAYYQRHKTAVDVGGFILGSIIPGMAGAKLYNAGSKLLGATRLGSFAGQTAGSLGILPSIEAKLVQQATAELAITGGKLSFLQPKALGALGTAIADDTLAGLAYMGAAEAAMNKSPIFDGQSAGDMVKDLLSPEALLKGSVLSGIFRGTGIYFKAKKELSLIDKELAPYRHSTELVEGLSASDQIGAWARDVKSRPEIDPEDLLAKQKQLTRDKTDQVNFQRARAKALELTGGDDVIARQFVHDVWQMSSGETFSSMHKLTGVKRLADTVGDEKFVGKTFYKRLDPTELPVTNEGAAMLRNDQVPVGVPLKQPFRAGENTVVINRATGMAQEEFLPLLGDMLKSGQKMEVVDGGLKVGDEVFNVVKSPTGFFNAASRDINRMEVEARNIYYSELKEPIFSAEPIGAMDIARLEHALATITPNREISIKLPDTGDLRFVKGAQELRAFIEEQKLAGVQSLRESGASIHEISQRLNVSEAFALDTSRVSDADLFRMQNSTYTSIGDKQLIKPYMEPSHYVASYEAPSKEMAAVFRDATKAQVYLAGRQKAFDTVATELLGRVAGEDYVNQFISPELLNPRLATRYGAGPGMLSFANGEYRSLESHVERIGKLVGDIGTKKSAEVLDALNPYASSIALNKSALAEFNSIENKLLATSERYVPIAEFGGLGTMVPKSFLDEAKRLMEAQNLSSVGMSVDDIYKFGISSGMDTSAFIDIKNSETFDFIQQHVKKNDARLTHHQEILRNRGINVDDMRGTFYAVPVDTAKYPHFAFVKDVSVGGGEVSAIFATNANDLQTKIAKIRNEFPSYEVITKQDQKLFFEAQGAYEYDKSIHSSYIDSSLKRRGILSDFLPSTDSPRRLDEYLNWHGMQERKLVREAVNHAYGSVFNEIEQMGRDMLATQTSTFGGTISNLMSRQPDNPWLDYRRTALNIPKKENSLFGTIDDWISRKADNAFNSAKKLFSEFQSSKKTDDSLAKLDEMAAHMEKTQLGTPYANAMLEAYSDVKIERGVLQKYVARVNSILSGFQLGLDPMNAVSNVINSPVLVSAEIKHIQKMIANAPEFEDLRKLMTMKVPGTEIVMSSPMKLQAQSIAKYFSDEGEALLKKYIDKGFDITELQQHRAMINDLAVTGAELEGAFNKKIDKVLETGRKLTLNKHAEQLNRFVAANIMDNITAPLVKAGKMTEAEADSMINTFVNRTQGNALASQRPQIFQGAIGSAVSLYQTYTWNLGQQLFKYIGNKDKQAALMAMVMQGSINGLNGLPGFNTVNDLIARSNGNPQHHDIYEQLHATGGREAAEWLLYGMGSNALGLLDPRLKTNLYARGDINPRNWTVIPTSLDEIPAIRSTSNIVKQMHEMFSKTANGAELWPTVLEGIEHMNINRPLTGMAQMLAGRSTTNEGSTISAVDASHLESWIRLVGVKPMHEAMALDGLYRYKSYAAYDKDKRNQLGEVIRSKMLNGEAPSQEEFNDFLRKYVATGGDQKNFMRWYAGVATRTNTSVVNTAAVKLNNPQARYLQTLMGGEGLPDHVYDPALLEQQDEQQEEK